MKIRKFYFKELFRKNISWKQKWNRFTWQPKAIVIDNNPISIMGYLIDMESKYGEGWIL